VDNEGNNWIGHGGSSVGGTTQLWLLADDGLVIAMASNLSELNYGDILPRLAKIFVEHPTAKAATSQQENSN
jgi:hypothetical protein